MSGTYCADTLPSTLRSKGSHLLGDTKTKAADRHASFRNKNTGDLVLKAISTSIFFNWGGGGENHTEDSSMVIKVSSKLLSLTALSISVQNRSTYHFICLAWVLVTVLDSGSHYICSPKAGVTIQIHSLRNLCLGQNSNASTSKSKEISFHFKMANHFCLIFGQRPNLENFNPTMTISK